MKYVIQVEVSPEVGNEVEANPSVIQEMVGAWQATNPIRMYFSISRRAMTIIVEADNEDAFFEPLHKTWVATRSYPNVSPVVDGSEFPALLERVGIGH